MTATHETHFTGHKFRALTEYFWRNLETGTVYFSPPSKLNDPFDCQIDLLKAVRLAKQGMGTLDERALALWRAFAATISEPAATCGVFSLCAGDLRGLQERLLWSHYAADHKGVCVTYQIPYTFVDSLIGCSGVSYGEVKLLDAIRKLDLSTTDREARLDVVKCFLTTKAEQWAYEKEVRFISFQPGSVQFERSWLRQVCFGLNTSSEDRQKVVDQVRTHGYTECSFVELVHSDDGLYALESREVRS